jgi:hypothetical protein
MPELVNTRESHLFCHISQESGLLLKKLCNLYTLQAGRGEGHAQLGTRANQQHQTPEPVITRESRLFLFDKP